MNMSKIYNNLCYKDPRHPMYEDLYGDLVSCGEPPKPREDCYCDNCFSGRDELAVELIKCKEDK